MRLAFFSPLNPAPSGISDYSEELLPYLAPHAEIELIVDSRGEPTNPALKNFPQRSLHKFYNRAANYDVILYQMGNSPAHAAIYETLLKYPGVVVLHDVVLHHLCAWLTLERGNRGEYLDAMRNAYGDAGARAAMGEIQGRALADRFEFPLNENVVRAARALIVHSEYAAKQVQSIAPNTPVAIIPMGIALPEIVGRETAREQLKLEHAEFLIAIFGDVQPNKRVLPALNAFAEFHAQYPRSRFLLIGRASPLFDVRGAAQTLGIADAVELIGYAPRKEYDLYIAAADLCLNLRYPTAGETSASLLRLLGAEKACIVTDTGAFADLADEVCVKIRADAWEVNNLRATFEFFAQSPERGDVLGKSARAFVEQGHTLEISAKAYADFLNEVIAERATSRSYLRAWNVPTNLQTSENIFEHEYPAPASLEQQNSTDWKDAVAGACADLRMRDDTRLRSVAQALVELGL